MNKSVLREILNHRLCVVHPNIVRFHEVFLTPRHLAIVMEYAAGGDMFEYVIRHKRVGYVSQSLSPATADPLVVKSTVAALYSVFGLDFKHGC